MVGGTGPQNWVDSQTRSGAILQQPDLRHEQYGGAGGRQRVPPLPTRNLGSNSGRGSRAGLEPQGCAALSAGLTQRSPTAS